MTYVNLIGTPEVAEILGVHVMKAKRMALAGELPYVTKRPGRTGAYLFDRAVVERHKAERDAAEPAA